MVSSVSTTEVLADRAKLDSILRLTQHQVRALESKDMAMFSRALAARRALIDSLGESGTRIADDPGLMGLVNEINNNEKAAEKLLFHRITRIKHELDKIRQIDSAKRAYRKTSLKVPVFVRDPDSPRMFDRKS